MTTKIPSCPKCRHKHFILKKNPSGDTFKDIIECGKCGNQWQSSKNAEPYASSKFVTDKR